MVGRGCYHPLGQSLQLLFLPRPVPTPRLKITPATCSAALHSSMNWLFCTSIFEVYWKSDTKSRHRSVDHEVSSTKLTMAAAPSYSFLPSLGPIIVRHSQGSRFLGTLRAARFSTRNSASIYSIISSPALSLVTNTERQGS